MFANYLNTLHIYRANNKTELRLSSAAKLMKPKYFAMLWNKIFL